ncbi:hypothetical protein DE4576_03385 [Mycobacterium marinum]|uniref:hypothetical protein n=1 Tax=Mycobacterium marinum TaxID=1781 RepID=UPI000E3D2B17|nr:hypothetical protein [Mycobacterium marinum]RFZ65616.1 hypothetical protein DE4576_03385 [Mycobacterium marinum]
MTKNTTPITISESFDFLVDAKQKLIGLQVEPKDGEKFILPMAYETAEAVAMNILKLLLFYAPKLAQARLNPTV